MNMHPNRLRQAYHPSPADLAIDQAIGAVMTEHHDNLREVFRKIEKQKRDAKETGQAPPSPKA